MESFPNIYEQQKSNRRKTILIMLMFIVFFGFLGYGFDFFFLGNDPLGIVSESSPMFPIGTVVALLIGGGMAIWGLQGGAHAVLRSAGAVPVSTGDTQHRMLSNVVDEMVIASGLPRPQVYVIPDADPNAFATGKDPHHSHIAVTKGLLEKLNREELQGVIAHEIAHIRNYDIRLMTVIAALIGAALLLSDWAARSMRYGFASGKRSRGSSRSKGGGGGIVLILMALWILAIILAPLITRLLAMAVSRQREYLADATAAELTRNPLGLAKALQKIEHASEPTQSIKKSAAHLCIVDPLGRKVNFKEGALADLFATHPPISKRIMLLHAMAYQDQS